SDATLDDCLAEARRAVGESGRAQRVIKTVHGLGYRWVAPLEEDPAAALRPHVPAVSPSAAPSGLGETGEGGREHKLLAVLAIELTWPGPVAPETLGAMPGRVLTAWQETIVEQVQVWGGSVLQRAPALLLVAFGLPQTLEQVPQRAVEAALALQQLVVAAPDGAPGPVLRLAGHWGPVLVAVPAPEAPAPLRARGETLMQPVRLVGQAAPGELLVSPELGACIDGWCALAAREVQLAGQAPGLTRVYRVVGLTPPWARRELNRPRPLRPLVGRDRELRTLQELLARVAGGQGQVVGLLGEPGMGKSRLCYEVTTRHLPPAWACLEMRAVAYGQATPYRPIIDLLKAYC